jgi:molybdopterin-guanine dinucleotide biosynthesis protein A
MKRPLPAEVAGVILAGGQSSRMGGDDKGLIMLEGRALIDHVIDRFQPQVARLAISANRNQERYRQRGYPVIEDRYPGFQGPLAGMASALQSGHHPLVAFVPCDTPHLPRDLVSRLVDAWLDGHDLCYAQGRERRHYTMALIDRALLASLTAYLEAGDRQLSRWFQQQNAHAVLFEEENPFRNINTPRDLG